MATERFEDLYEVNLRGNYKVELQKLSSSLEAARADWDSLAATMEQNGAIFSRTKSDVTKLQKEVDKLGNESREVFPVQERLASSAKALADATNRLTKEQNKLNIVRLSELQVLEQARLKNDPKIIQARAEAAALVKLNKVLTEAATKREFLRLAEAAGLKLTDNSKKAFDAQAVAADRAAKAQERLAVVERLRQMGLDASGKPVPQDQPALPRAIGGKVTALGEQEARQAAQKKIQDAFVRERTQDLLKQDKAYQGLIESNKRLEEAKKKLNQTAEKTDGVFNRVSFTFRRLIGIMAVFTVARTVVREFNNLIASGIRFNATLETTRVGLAGFIAASAEVRDRFGNALTIDEQIIRSQNVAIDQMNKLRTDALRTAASYDDLAKSFQTAVAPGLQANLTVDQIRKLTVNISQAATGLGLAQDQLAEEIRSIFQGTISARNTRIATALGITNADIQRAKELGNLFQFLDGRFAAIAKTGKLLMNTFTGQLSNATDAFQQLLATSSQPLFEQLKAALRDVQASIFDVVNDAVVFKPEKLEAFKALFDGLANGVQGIRAAFATIDPKGFADTLSLVGQTLGAIASGIANALTTAFNLASPVVRVVSGIVETFTKLVSLIRSGVVGGLVGWLGQTVLILGKVYLAVTAFKKIYTLVVASGRAMRSFVAAMAVAEVSSLGTAASLGRMQKAAIAIRAAFGRLLIPLLAVAGVVAAIDLTFGKAFNFSLTDQIGGLFGALNDQLDKMLGNVQGFKEEATTISSEGVGQVVNDFREIVSEIQDLRKELKKTFSDLQFDLLKARKTAGLPDAVAAQIGIMVDSERELFNQTEKVRVALSQQTKAIEDQKDVVEKTRSINEQNALKDSADIERLIARRKTLRDAVDKQQDSVRRLRKLEKDVGPLATAPDGRFAINSRIESEAKLNQLLNEEKQLHAEQVNLLKKQDAESGNINAVQGQLEALLEKERGLRKELLALQKQQELIENSKLKAALIVSNLQGREKGVSEEAEVAAAKASLASVTQSGRIRAESLQKEADLMKLRAEFVVRESQLRKAIDDTLTTQSEKLKAGADADFDLVAALQDQLRIYQSQLDFEQRLFAARKARADFEARLAQQKESGGAGQGIARGLEEFALRGAGSDTAFEIGEKFGGDLATGLSETLGTALAETVAGVFDPNRNFDLGEAIGNLALKLGQDLFVQIVENLLAELITALGIGIGESLTDVAGAAAAGAAYATPVSAAADDILTSSLVGAAAMAASAAAIDKAATKLLIASGINIATGGTGAAGSGTGTGSGAFFANARGGPASRGFARGGRPLGIDARDTIPAWLRRGEWVIRPESVRKAEKAAPGFMDMLNKGQINFGALTGVAAAARGRAAPPSMPKRGFATGGAVVSRAPIARDAGGTNVVLQFHDEQTMDRALHAGSKATLRFARVNRQAYRAALGID